MGASLDTCVAGLAARWPADRHQAGRDQFARLLP